MNEQKEKYIQEQRNQIRKKRTEQALKDAKTLKEKPVTFDRPQEGKIEKRIGGMDTFHVEKGEEKNTYSIITKREYTFAYTIRACPSIHPLISISYYKSYSCTLGEGPHNNCYEPYPKN